MLVTPIVIIIGLLMGVLIAAPVGPVNVLCIQRTLQSGFWGGVAAGLGAVLGDGILAATAAFGVKAVSSVFMTHQMQIQAVGSIILLIFGGQLFFKKPVIAEQVDEMAKLVNNADAIPQSFFLTITNPGALLGIFALFGALASWLGHFDSMNAFVLVLAVMAGSMAWWFGLSWLICIIRHHLNEKRLRMINQFAAGFLILFGLSLLGKMFWQFII
ncbi:MAG: LysE family translocator [Methyloligellaceae bacterium]